jgi:hypothetical protein
MNRHRSTGTCSMKVPAMSRIGNNKSIEALRSRKETLGARYITTRASTTIQLALLQPKWVTEKSIVLSSDNIYWAFVFRGGR